MYHNADSQILQEDTFSTMFFCAAVQLLCAWRVLLVLCSEPSCTVMGLHVAQGAGVRFLVSGTFLLRRYGVQGLKDNDLKLETTFEAGNLNLNLWACRDYVSVWFTTAQNHTTSSLQNPMEMRWNRRKIIPMPNGLLT